MTQLLGILNEIRARAAEDSQSQPPGAMRKPHEAKPKIAREGCPDAVKVYGLIFPLARHPQVYLHRKSVN